MAKELLTAHSVRAITNAGVYTDGGGLRLIVTARGTKRWELWISINGRRREQGLGVYPSVSLKDARDKADEIRRAARNGVDLRQQRLDEQARSVSFKEAFETYFAVKCKQLSNAKHLKQWPSTMASYVFPDLRRRADRQTSPLLRSSMLSSRSGTRSPRLQSAFSSASRLYSSRRSCAARARRLRPASASPDLQTRHREVRHHPALPWQEVPAFIARLRSPAQRGWANTRLAFEFLILTATRSSEVRGAVWSEFDLDKAIWVIPKHRMKSRKSHGVPLSARSVAILREARALNPDAELLFEGTKKGRQLSDMTFTKVLRDAGTGRTRYGPRI